MFKPGHNCWRVAKAEKAACLVDGEAYFSALRQAILTAEQTIYIIGWDISSQFELLRDGTDDGMPLQLRDLLDSVARQKSHLHIYILVWDYSALLALDREWLPAYQFGLRTHERVHFSMQAGVMVSASHHQKFVVIDDSLAFCGGLDLTFGRWDTPVHDVNDVRRRDTDSGPVPRPYHDVQMMVNGPCARALGDLARQRWHDAEDEQLAVPSSRSLWLDDVRPEFENCDVAISLTWPADEVQDELRQVERLYIDMIESARDAIYIENQYLTADKIGAALKAALEADQGPEIVVVTPYKTVGWLSQNTMDVLRCRMIDHLRAADKHDRLRIYYPTLPGADENTALNVHAKVVVVDDHLLRVGSANLNNRSMGLDSECDLTLVANDEANRSAVRTFRDRLLAEHLGVSRDEVKQQWQQQKSLLGVIEALQGRVRTLNTLESTVPEEVQNNLPDKALLDPEAPIDSDALREILVPDESERKPAASRVLLGGLLLLLVLALFAVWRWTPLAEMVDVESLVSQIKQFQQGLVGPVIAIALIMIGGLAAIPITLLIIATMLVFGGLIGAVYGLIGSVLSAVIAYVAGQVLGKDVIRRLAGPRLNRISRQLARRGIMTIVIVRMIPVAPFVIVNLVAGASHIRLRDFAIGSFVGMIPGVLALALITDGVILASAEPSGYYLLLVALILIALAVATLVLRNWLLNFRNKQA